MSETINYKLHLTESSTTESFKEWREKMNGTDKSNMIKIDEVLNKKADNSVSVNAVLLSDGWSSGEPTCLQELNITGLTSAQNGTISLSQIATKEQREAARKAILSVSSQEDGKLVITCDGEKPNIDIPVCIILLG